MQTNSTTVPDHVNKFSFYDDPRAQMDCGAKCSVTNIVEILQNVTWFNQNKRAPVRMRGATSGKIIIPMAKGWLQVQAANVKKGYIDVLIPLISLPLCFRKEMYYNPVRILKSFQVK